MHIAGFTGTQEGMTSQQKSRVAECFARVKELHHGDCVGADATADDIAHGMQIRVVIHPPVNHSKRAWCKYDEIFEEKDYLVRNRDIVDSSDFLIATPKEEVGEELRSGTWSTVRYARKKGKLVFVVRPSGRVEKYLHT